MYKLYYDFNHPISRLMDHQILAINRGEKEGILKPAIALPGNDGLAVVRRAALKPTAFVSQFVRAAAEDSYDRLIFPSGKIRLVLRQLFCQSVCNASPQIRYIRQAAEELAALRKERGISMLVLPLVLGYELRQQNPYCAQAGIYLEKLIHSLISGRHGEIHTCIGKLLGLGTGLTPSADDTLLGMIFVFRALPFQTPEGVQLFPESVGQLCDRCTTQISAAYLKAMLSGAPFERMEQVFRGLCGEEPLNIYKLTEIGSNSGSEMLLGMLIALRICGYDIAQKEELQ